MVPAFVHYSAAFTFAPHLLLIVRVIVQKTRETVRVEPEADSPPPRRSAEWPYHRFIMPTVVDDFYDIYGAYCISVNCSNCIYTTNKYKIQYVR